MKDDKKGKPKMRRKKEVVPVEKIDKPIKPSKPSNKPTTLAELLRLGNLPKNAVVIAEQKDLDEETLAAIEHAAMHYRPGSIEKSKARRMAEADVLSLEAIVSEYLQSFIVIGYDLSGEKVQMMHARNAQEYDSLVEHARGSLLTLIMRAQQQLPGFPNG